MSEGEVMIGIADIENMMRTMLLRFADPNDGHNYDDRIIANAEYHINRVGRRVGNISNLRSHRLHGSPIFRIGDIVVIKGDGYAYLMAKDLAERMMRGDRVSFTENRTLINILMSRIKIIAAEDSDNPKFIEDELNSMYICPNIDVNDVYRYLTEGHSLSPISCGHPFVIDKTDGRLHAFRGFTAHSSYIRIGSIASAEDRRDDAVRDAMVASERRRKITL